MKNITGIMALFIPCLFAGSFAYAQEEISPAEQLTAVLAKTETLQAQVLQLTLDQQGREVQESYAELRLEKPNRFYWHATNPFEQVMVTDGELLWIYEPDLEQVTIDYFDKDYSRTPAMLLSADSETLESSFNVSVTEPEAGLLVFHLLPLEADALILSLNLTFENETLLEMQFEDSLGQKSNMSFSNTVSNIVFPDHTFTFDLENDVDGMGDVQGIEVLDNTLY